MNRALFTLCALATCSISAAQFGPAMDIETNEARRPLALVAMDVNGDGYNDLVASLQSDERIVWYQNDGNDGFGGQQVLFESATYINELLVLDVDMDGVRDLVGTSLVLDQLVWWRGLGNGDFDPLDVLVGTDDQPGALLPFDYDGDGLLDFIVGNHMAGTIQWTRNLGGGQFYGMLFIDNPGYGLHSLKSADVDGDGSMDMVTGRYATGTSEIAWYHNTGVGGFSEPNIVYQGADTMTSVGVADLNNDGHSDIFTGSWAENALIVYFNDGFGGFPDQTIVDTTGVDHHRIEATDMDQDGDLDLLFATRPQNSIRWLMNDGTGGFTAGGVLATTIHGTMSLFMDDLTNDGLPDIAYCGYDDSRIAWHVNLGGGSFGPQIEVTTQVDGAAVVTTGDLNNDGNLDVITASAGDGRVAWYPGSGGGTFAPQRTLSNMVPAACAVIVMDLEGDGDRDVIAASRIENNVVSFLNDGTGQFEGPSILIPDVDQIGSMVACDLDLDGDSDLVVSGYSHFAYHLNEAGTFGPAQMLTGNVSGVVHFAVADVDHDSLPDIVHSVNSYSMVGWYKNLGSGEMSAQLVVTDFTPGGGAIALADMNGDGHLDILHSGIWNVDLYMGTDSAWFNPPIQITTSNSSPDLLAVADINADGFPDILEYQTFDDFIGYSLNLGDGSGICGPLQTVPGAVDGVSSIHLQRMDANASLDLLATDRQDDRVFWHRNYYGSPYRIEGHRYIDVNGSGSREPDEPGAAWGMLTCEPQLVQALSGVDGAYVFNRDAGTHLVTALDPGPFWGLVNDSPEVQVTLTDEEPIAADIDFGYSQVVDTSVVSASFVVGQGPCGALAPAWISWTNQGTRIEQGSVVLELDTAYSFLSSIPPPDEQSGDLLIWHFDSLSYFQTATILIELQLPDVELLGASLVSQLTVHTMNELGDTTGTWADILTDIVQCAYDPNDKQVQPVGYGDYGAVDIDEERFTYTIRFQNTGSAPALDVTLRDVLSSALNPLRIEVLGYSHAPSSIHVHANNTLTVRFAGINLPDSSADPVASQGFFRFCIHTLPGAPDQTPITNTAAIHFDLNPAVLTNTTLNTLVDCDLWLPTIEALGEGLLSATNGVHYQWYLNNDPIDQAIGPILTFEASGAYSVQVSSVYGCVAISEPFAATSPGILEHGQPWLVASPNPVGSTTTVRSSLPFLPTSTIFLRDMQGRLLRSIRGSGTHNVEIDCASLARGQYILSVHSEQGPNHPSIRLVVQ